MKQLFLLLICMVFTFGCQGNFFQKKNDEIRVEKSEATDKAENEALQRVPFVKEGDNILIPVRSLKEITNSEANFDSINKTLQLLYDENRYFLIQNVPVVQRNGLLLPGKVEDFKIINDEAWLSKQFLKDTLGLNVKFVKDEAFINKNTVMKHKENDEVTTLSSLGSIENVIDLMKFLESPIKGAQVDTIPSHLPGAKRTYRNGEHEGMDWYGFSTGVPINRKTKVFAMANGVIVRADHEYNRYSSKEERNRDLQIAAKTGFTPIYILDRLRGRQVWIQYENGLQARFAHLDRIPSDLKVGDVVTSDTLVGYVGNSGTSGDVKGDQSELHLHLDLLYKGELFWKGLTEKEIAMVLKTVFTS